MPRKILVAFSSRYGNAEEVADFLTDYLLKKGHRVDRVDLKAAGMFNKPDPSKYDIVVVGGSMKINMLTKPTRSFLKGNRKKFPNVKLAVYVCSGTAAMKKGEAQTKYIDRPLGEWGIKPDLTLSIGPVFDFSERSKLGKMTRNIMRKAKDDMEKDYEIELDPDGKNDLRNWDEIRAFASRIEGI